MLEEAKKYGFIQDNQVWLKPFMNYPARQVGLVKEVEEDSLVYFAHRFGMFREKVENLIKRIEESENKGSFLMKVMHMKEQIGNYDALGDFEVLYHELDNAENEIKAAISRNRDKNLSAKVAMASEAESLQDSTDWEAATERLKELREAWIKTGPVDKELTEEIESRFRNAIDKFFKRKKDFNRDKQQMTRAVIEKYKDLIRRSEALAESSDWEETTRKMKQLQNEWKTVGGKLPRKTVTDLWNNFRKAHNKFFDRLKDHITATKNESKEKFMEDNLSRKQNLVAQAEALLGLSVYEATTRAKELQAEWKKVGPVKQPESDQVWDRFVNACDKVFEMSSLEHYMRKRPLPAERNSPADQVHARINALREFIKSDKQELEVLEENLGKLNPTPHNEAFRNMLEGKIRHFKRKINTKNDLIEIIKLRLHAVEKD